jgi:predicted ATPase
MGSIIGGVANIAGSLVGRGARKREAEAAAVEQAAQKQAFKSFEFTNVYSGLENTAEDLTINQDAAQFQAQQTDAALAQGLDAIVAGGGGGGGAQAIAAAALQSKQGVSADIARQEQNNQMARAQQAARLQEMEATGDMDIQSQEYSRSQELLNMANARKLAADKAKKDATQQLIGGVGQLGKGIVGAATGGAIGGNIGGFLKGFGENDG